MTISEQLKKAIAKASEKQSLRSIADETGVDVGVLSRWLASKRKPGADALDAIAKWAGLTLKKK